MKDKKNIQNDRIKNKKTLQTTLRNNKNKNTPLVLKSYKTILFLFFISIIGLCVNYYAYSEILPLSERTPQVGATISDALTEISNSETSLITELSKIEKLNLSSLGIKELRTGDFSGLVSLKHLNLFQNKLSKLPNDIFLGLNKLSTLHLGRNEIEPLPLVVSLIRIGEDHFKGVIPTGAPFNIKITVNLANGYILNNGNEITISKGDKYSDLIQVYRTPGTTDPITIDIATIPILPDGHFGYTLIKSDFIPLELDLRNINPPEFSEGFIAQRYFPAIFTPGEKIGDAVNAIDIDNDSLIYSLDGPDSSLFDIDVSTGEILSKPSIDYSIKTTYYVSVTVSDGKFIDEIVVIIERLSNRAPEFTSGEITLRTINTNLPSGSLIGEPITATDIDQDHLIYSLGGTDSKYFDLDKENGQLKTKPFVDYSTQELYQIRVSVSDGKLSDHIIVIVNVLTNNPPSFLDEGIIIYKISENTPSGIDIGIPLNASDPDRDTLTYHLEGPDSSIFDIDSITGQLKTKEELDYESRSIYLIRVIVSDSILTDTSTVLIEVINTDDTSFDPSILPINERTPQVRDAILRLFPKVDNVDDITMEDLANITDLFLRSAGILELKTGDFSGLTGLRKLNLFDNQLMNLPLGIFDGLTSLDMLRLGNNIIQPFPLIVSIQHVDEGIYQAVIPVGAPFDIELPIEVRNGKITNGKYSVTIPKGQLYSESIRVVPSTDSFITTSVDIGVLPHIPLNHYGYVIAKSNVCNRTQQVVDAISFKVNEGSDCINISELDLAQITSLNLDDMSISSLRSDDFEGMLSLESLSLSNNMISDIPTRLFLGLFSLNELNLMGNRLETLPLDIFVQWVGGNQYKIVVPSGAPFRMTIPLIVENGSIDDGITEIVIPTGNIGSRTISISRTPGTINEVRLDLGMLPVIPSLHSGYTLRKSNQFPLTIFDKINVVPVFDEAIPVIRSINENSKLSSPIGEPVVANDANGDSLVYSLSGTDSTNFYIDNDSGQLYTANILDYETNSSYSVVVSVSDLHGGTSTIDVSIKVLDLPENQSPLFVEGSGTTRTVKENVATGVNIGEPIVATDPDNDTLTYHLSGIDVESFSIVSTTGQLRTKGNLDYESKTSYSVLIHAVDGNEGEAIIPVIISIIDIDEVPSNSEPVFLEGLQTSRLVLENTEKGIEIGTPITASDADNDTLVYTLSGIDNTSFSINEFSGQILTLSPLDYEEKSVYSLIVVVSDGALTDTIILTINVKDLIELTINNAPVFNDGDSLSITISDKILNGDLIGNPISAVDDNSDSLVYTLSGVDASYFSIDRNTGQIKINSALDISEKSTFSLIVTVSDGDLSDRIDITIIFDIDEISVENNYPVFKEGDKTTSVKST
ncbi:cadherin domain-containing protein [Candidatus Poribacteria bacterium]|nr:cadherin domain-containing protein [Candidatus Poribacteria bacterium]